MKTAEVENKLKKHAKTTKSAMQTPFNVKEVISKMEVCTMHKPKNILKRAAAIAAVVALCIVTATVAPLASGIKGFFSDIVRFDGAVTGTKYENATNDIEVKAMEAMQDTISLELVFKNSAEAPFAYIEEIAVGDYMILDRKSGEILRMESYPEHAAKGAIKDGRAVVPVSIKDVKLASGEEYTIIIEKMYGLSKADPPLHITGNWECKFVK